MTAWEHQVLLSILFLSFWTELASSEEEVQLGSRQRPFHVENTSSRPITEVKQHWAWLVLGWVTAWEHQVLLSSFVFGCSNQLLTVMEILGPGHLTTAIPC